MAETITLHAGAAAKRGLRPGQILAVTSGNALEFYDFITYAFFAVQIGRSFFPSQSPSSSLLASLATFGAGFLTRPLGAWVIGRMGDRLGRKPAMLLSFSLIGLAVAGLALTPSYRQIGVMAPILVVGFRLLQGFALGGEVGPSTAFLMETAPVHRRGLVTSLQAMSADFAVLVAGLVGVGLSSVMDATALDAYGWRIAVLLGAAIVPFGLMLRRSLDDSLQHPEPAAAAPGRPLPWVVGTGLAMLACGTISTYSLDYLTTFAATTLAMPVRVAFGATVVVGLCSVACDPLGGWLSDRFGRKPVMLVPGCALLVSVLPCFWALSHWRTPAVLYGCTALLTICSATASVSMIVVIIESLPKAVRSGGLALIYAVSISVFGGSTQFLVAWLISVTGNPLAPAWYMTGAVAVGLAAMLLTPETAPGRR